MNGECDRTGTRPLTTKYATTAFGSDRETVEEAYPGDVVGFVNATGLHLGDTIYAPGPSTAAGDVPAASRGSRRRSFAAPRPLDTGTPKQFRKRARAQLDEEGVVQVLARPRPRRRRAPIARRRRPLQFEVFGHRLGGRVQRPAEILDAGYQAIRRTDPARRARAPRDRRRHPDPQSRSDGAARRLVREPVPPAAPAQRLAELTR